MAEIEFTEQLFKSLHVCFHPEGIDESGDLPRSELALQLGLEERGLRNRGDLLLHDAVEGVADVSAVGGAELGTGKVAQLGGHLWFELLESLEHGRHD